MIWVDAISDLKLHLTPEQHSLLHANPLMPALAKLYAHVEIMVISQSLTTIPEGVQCLLSNVNSECWLRKVVIHGNGKPIVYATTIIPHQVYQQYKLTLNTLGNNAIGENFLYKHNFLRSNFKFCYTTEQIQRSSIFESMNDKILLIEAFAHQFYESC